MNISEGPPNYFLRVILFYIDYYQRKENYCINMKQKNESLLVALRVSDSYITLEYFSTPRFHLAICDC